MPVIEEESLMNLFADDPVKQLLEVKRVKHAIIGNKRKKSELVISGVMPRLVAVLEDDNSSVELMCEVITIIGSLAHGSADTVQALVNTDAVSLLLQGLCHSNVAIVTACARALKTIYLSNQSSTAPVVFHDTRVTRQLILLLGQPPPLCECAAIILANSCQSRDHQEFLFANGIMSSLRSLLTSDINKVVYAGLQCLCAVVHGNQFTASTSLDVVCDSGSLVTVLTHLLLASHPRYINLKAAQCLTYLCLADAISSECSTITLRVLPTLVQLCGCGDSNSDVRADSALVLAQLVEGSPTLQEMAAISDQLITTVVSFFAQQSSEDTDLIDESHLKSYNRLRKSGFLLLAALGTAEEDIRFKVAAKSQLIPHLVEALRADDNEVQIAAARCLLSLSRSLKLLRTYLADAEVWKPVMKMLPCVGEECLVTITSVTCNLLLSFSTSRKPMVEEGVVELLCPLVEHSNADIQLNALWALMNCCREADQEVVRQVRNNLSPEKLLGTLAESASEPLKMKCVGLLVNYTQFKDDAETMLSEYGASMLGLFSSLLSLPSSPPELIEQILCVMVNISCGSAQTRDILAEHSQLMEALAFQLRRPSHNGVCMSACTAIKHLADVIVGGHTHRQNCLKEYGLQQLVQKLELTDNSLLQDLARQTVEQFSMATL